MSLLKKSTSTSSPSSKSPAKKPLFIKEDDLIKVFMVFSSSEISTAPNPDSFTTEEVQPITVTASHDQALMAISRLIYMNHFDHYKSWCSLRDKTPGFIEESWQEYLSSLDPTINPEDHFTIIEATYSFNDLVMFLRMLMECKPLVLPFEAPEEVTSYLYRYDGVEDIPPHINRLCETDEIADEAIKPLIYSYLNSLEGNSEEEDREEA